MRSLEAVTGARPAGLRVVVLGLLLVIIGGVGLVLGGGSDPQSVSEAVVTSAESTTAAPRSAPAAPDPATSSSPTTTSAPATVTTPPETEGPDGPALVDAFIVDFIAAIDADDVDFLFDRLHPLVLSAFSPELCRSFLAGEIVTLTDYRATGPVAGPSSRTQLGTVVDDFYEVPVSFVFQGQTFETMAAVTIVDEEVRWFTQCR